MYVLVGIHDSGGIDNDVIVALITAFASICVVTIPLLISHRRTNRELRATSEKVERTYDAVNRVEEEERVPVDGGPRPSLGQIVREVRDNVKTGFDRNERTHDEIIQSVEQLGHRVDNHRRDLNHHDDRITKIERDLE